MLIIHTQIYTTTNTLENASGPYVSICLIVPDVHTYGTGLSGHRVGVRDTGSDRAQLKLTQYVTRCTVNTRHTRRTSDHGSPATRDNQCDVLKAAYNTPSYS